MTDGEHVELCQGQLVEPTTRPYLEGPSCARSNEG